MRHSIKDSETHDARNMQMSRGNVLSSRTQGQTSNCAPDRRRTPNACMHMYNVQDNLSIGCTHRLLYLYIKSAVVHASNHCTQRDRMLFVALPFLQPWEREGLRIEKITSS